MANIRTTFDSYTFGDSFLQAFLNARKMKQQQEQFEANQLADERQNKLAQSKNLFELYTKFQEVRPQANVIGRQAFTSPPQGALQGSNFIDLFGEEVKGKYYAPREKEESPYKIYESGYVEIDPITKKPKMTSFGNETPKPQTPHFKTDESGVVHEWDETTGEFKPTNIKERTPSNGITEYQQMMAEERKLANEQKFNEKIGEMKEETSNILTILQTAEEKDGKISYNNNQIPKKLLTGVYRNKVNKLIDASGARSSVNNLLFKARKDNPDFEQRPKAERRDILKKIIDSYNESANKAGKEPMNDEERDILYQFAESYRD